MLDNKTFKYLLAKLLKEYSGGKTKVQKICFFADLIYNGKQENWKDNIGYLTRASYIRLHYGPFSMQIQDYLGELEHSNYITDTIWGYTISDQTLLHPELDDTDKKESIHRCLQIFGNWKSKSLINLTHLFTEWKEKTNFEEINLKKCWDEISNGLKEYEQSLSEK